MRQVTFLKRFANFDKGETASFGNERATAMVEGGVAEWYEPDNQRQEPLDSAVPDRPKPKDKAGK
jgi:hypothetical protein